MEKTLLPERWACLVEPLVEAFCSTKKLDKLLILLSTERVVFLQGRGQRRALLRQQERRRRAPLPSSSSSSSSQHPPVICKKQDFVK
jgi:hypothetical protein